MDRFDEIYGRVHRFYTSEASVETDLQKSRDALMGYQRIVNFLKQYLTIDLMKTGKNGPLQYINSDMADRPYPSGLTTRNMILIKGWDFMDDPLSIVQVALCIGPSMQGRRLTGLFTKDGINRMPTIFLYVNPDRIDYSLGQVFRRQLTEFVATSRALQKTFIHEYKHYTDGIEALLKNIQSNPLRGYKIFKPMPEDKAQQVQDKKNNPNITYDFGTYVRNTSEVNARYAEWVVDILYAFDNLAEVKRRGILGAFPTFQMFWDYMWAHYAPDEFLEYSTPKLEKYLKKRLYKLYDYTLDMSLPPKTRDEAQRLAKQLLEKEQR